MVRVPYVSREELDADGQEIYDRIREDRGTEEVGLQFRALLNSPQSAGHLTSLGASLRLILVQHPTLMAKFPWM